MAKGCLTAQDALEQERTAMEHASCRLIGKKASWSQAEKNPQGRVIFPPHFLG